jgi:hypothetical protein
VRYGGRKCSADYSLFKLLLSAVRGKQIEKEGTGGFHIGENLHCGLP